MPPGCPGAGRTVLCAERDDPRGNAARAEQRDELVRRLGDKADAVHRIVRLLLRGKAERRTCFPLLAANTDLRPVARRRPPQRADKVEPHGRFDVAAAADRRLRLAAKLLIVHFVHLSVDVKCRFASAPPFSGVRGQFPTVAPQGKPLALPW